MSYTQTNPMKFKIEVPIFRQGSSGDTERLSNLPKVAQPVSGQTSLSVPNPVFLDAGPSLKSSIQPFLPLSEPSSVLAGQSPCQLASQLTGDCS